MTPEYAKPLYLLPFDHRHSYLSGMFHFEPPLDPGERQAVIDSKRLIYDGLLKAIDDGDVAEDAAGLLVDEEFGAAILADAKRRGIVTAVSVEQSGSDEFDFEYGREFVAHIDAVAPTFAKVLVRYNPHGDAEMNARQRGRLKSLSDHCRAHGPRFMFELLVPATDAQKDQAGSADAYDQQLRPGLMDEAIRELQGAGIEPDVWKIEGLAQREDCERIVATARRDGRGGVGCIVLGRGADAEAVRAWLRTAASVDGFIGFAVGRTTFWDAVAGWRDRKAPRDAAVAQIAERYRGWVETFESRS